MAGGWQSDMREQAWRTYDDAVKAHLPKDKLDKLYGTYAAKCADDPSSQQLRKKH